jgi:uncharacterized protein YidB (DUF937 family)
MPSSRMTALLALLAVAGYQNRDRLGQILGNITGQRPSDASSGAIPGVGGSSSGSGIGGLLGGLFGGGGAAMSGGLGDLINNMTGNGHAEAAKSWVQSGANKELSATQLEEALGGDTLDHLVQQTGLSRDELLSRLQSVLPTAVDKLTPQGRLPTESETSQWRV